MVAEESFLQAVEELEELNKNFSIKGVPEEYKDVWTPNDEIRMWSVPRSSAELLKLFVLAKKPQTILELGTSSGYSTIWLASGAKSYGGKVYTIELAKPKIEIAKEVFEKTSLSPHIEQLQGKISEVLSSWDKKIDFVFMDADKRNYFSYIKQLEPHLNPGAMLIADNAIDFKEHMQDYLKYIQEDSKYESYLIPIDNGLMISVRV